MPDRAPITDLDVIALAEALPEVSTSDYRDATAIAFRGRSFAHLRGDGRVLFVKSTPDEREAVVESDPEAYSRWWASGRFAWIEARLDLAPGDEIAELLTEAWRLTAPQRMVRAYDGGNAAR